MNKTVPSAAIALFCFLSSTWAARFDASTEQTILLKSDGSVWVMGSNYFGQAGDGTRGNDALMQKQTAVDAVAVASGSYCHFFIKSDKTLWGMGNGYYGALGNGPSAGSIVPVPISGDVIAVAGGSGFTLFVKSDHSLWGMGKNDVGQLGDGSLENRLTPVKIADDVAAIGAGGRHAGFVKTDGTLWTMGNNDFGQLGDGTTISRNVPAQVAQNVRSAHFGSDHSLFVKADNTLWAMGFNSDGRLGNGTTTDQALPVQVASAVSTASADGGSSYFVKTDHTLWACGTVSHPSLDYFSRQKSSPIQLEENVAAVAAGTTHTIFSRPDGSFWAFGNNTCGPFGLGISGGMFTKAIQISSGAPVPLQAVTVPQATPPAGIYPVTIAVSLSTPTPGATLLYAINSLYSPEYGNQYESPIVLAESANLQAMAVKGGYLPSPIFAASYNISGSARSVGAPVFTPEGGVYRTGTLLVTISTATPDAEIHYEMDGREPGMTSPRYTAPIQLDTGFSGKISARAYKVGLKASAVRSASYEVLPMDDPTKVVTPDITSKDSTFDRSLPVSITCRTKGAAIYYTLDGSLPTASSMKYKKPFRIQKTTTVKAIALRDGLTDSDVATVKFRKR